MGNGNSQPEAPGHRLDADAFCVVCSSVNPEGTLICKTCGNNLRDQKAQRVAGTLAVDANLLEPERTAWLPKALVVLAILVVLWTAMNLGDIEEWLVGAQAADLTGGQTYWEGPNSGVLDEMAQELESNPLTEQEKEAAQNAIQETPEGAPAAGSYDGHYVLLKTGGVPGDYGEALVRQVDDERVLFVARVNRGKAEVRGEGFFEGDSRIGERDTAGLMINGRYFGARGFASYGGNTWYTCYAQSNLSDATFSAIVLKVR
ncbi:MAG: hypothetical protein NTZ09_16750 [Candidatus Hydrogenedentes bacterium]|nr:hypothetical protein [Candidatus Hydrogenedentota bacterium]